MAVSVVLRLPGLLVLSLLAGAIPVGVAAQDVPGAATPAAAEAQGEPFPGQGSITFERLDAPDPNDAFGDKLELYRFTFENPTEGPAEDRVAALPEPEPFFPGQDQSPTISEEAMVVFVEAGSFVLYTPPTMEEGAVVVVSGNGDVPIEEWESQIQRVGEPQSCASPCSVPPDRYALLDEQDYVFHRERSGCVY